MHFEKVSLEQWKKDACAIYYENKPFDELQPVIKEDIIKSWESIKLPQRSSIGSAGYDFYIPYYSYIMHDSSGTILTGIRWVVDRCEQNNVLMLFPRSGLGCNYGMRLMNTVGIIDSDYWQSDNQGHIIAKINVEYSIELEKNKAFMQGVILPFGKVDDDNVTTLRNGGFGSSDKR